MDASNRDEVVDRARMAVERTLWAWGIQGDSCALLTTRVLESLDDAGLQLTSADEH